MENKAIDMVITSCGRLNLLDRTIKSFDKFNTHPISKLIIIDDSADKEIHNELSKTYTDNRYQLIFNGEKKGLIPSIDIAYSFIETEYFFHCEDDWEFMGKGFIDKSLVILENKPNILQVWLRGDKDPNGHPVEPEIYEIDGVKYKLMAVNHNDVWHGFSFNPTVRRLKDYKLIAPWSGIQLDGFALTRIGYQENHIGRVYYEQHGFRAASLIEEYCVHIGWSQRTDAWKNYANK